MIYCVIAVIVVLFVLIAVIIYLNEKNKELQRKYKEKEQFALGALEELYALKQEMAIKQEERNDAQAKIDGLHNGDVVDNSIDRLSKHKSN